MSRNARAERLVLVAEHRREVIGDAMRAALSSIEYAYQLAHLGDTHIENNTLDLTQEIKALRDQAERCMAILQLAVIRSEDSGRIRAMKARQARRNNRITALMDELGQAEA